MTQGICINFKIHRNTNNTSHRKQKLTFKNSIQTRTLRSAQDCRLVLKRKRKTNNNSNIGNTVRELERKLENELRHMTNKKKTTKIRLKQT